MKTLTATVRCDRSFGQLEECFIEQFTAPKPLPIAVNGLPTGATRAFLAELLYTPLTEGKRNAVILLPEEHECAAVTDFLNEVGIPTAFYPKRDFVTFPVTASHELERVRLSVLRKLSGGGCAVVTTPDAAIQYTMPPERLAAAGIFLRSGDEIAPGDLALRLEADGFSRVDTVEGAGQFAVRGGIFDIFSPSEPYPVRIEFFGDEIDRMGHFDPLSQRVIADASEFSLLPAKEVLTDADARATVAKAIKTALAKVRNEAGRATLQTELDIVESDMDFAFADKYISLIYPQNATLFSYLAVGERRPISIVLGSAGVKKALASAEEVTAAEIREMQEDGTLSGKAVGFCADTATYEKVMAETACLHINTFSDGLGSMRLAGLYGFRCRRTAAYGDNRALLIEDMKNYIATNYRTVLCSESAAVRENTEALLRDNGITPLVFDDRSFSPDAVPFGAVAIVPFALDEGYELLSARTAVIALDAMRGEAVVKRRSAPRRILKKIGAGERILSYSELTPGDYVVHDTHGIGQYEKIESLKIGGVTRDYVTIRYAGTDKLHIPADRIESISRYIGAHAEDGSVRLSKIGGTEWYRAKQKAKAAAKDIAKDLIALYAERKRRAGFAFPPDSDLEREFDNAFEFEETEPQLAAIEEIKADMMNDCPMDRLLCGDVGFGKTEVAFRAAFKAIAAGKQVALLVPTTILCLQHYETALSRFRGYPVSIEMISSFRTAGEQQKILRRLARGEINFIIGTHSLLGKNVAFQDLGLLIVDEEQRFGVVQKEKLKKIAVDVDVLTLSATPIPRTLNMAMSGIRDMSVLDEAPLDRYPVQTYVLEYDETVIYEAIRRELRRAGQVLYLYNRVETIDLCAGRLQKAIPEARVVYAHGQMDKDDLEEIWQALVRGEIDILVCTTIIETGVDLPNANTLIIENADRMGLSQLHQLRGRVGRSGRHAYAYFTFRPGKALTEIAEKRLSAIRDYAEFGAGFRIALRDLEIRGAGNLLGSEQHGHIDAVGYDMYIRLLNEAVLEEKGVTPEPVFESKVEIALDALIPESYIQSASQRMDMYKKISLITSESDLSDVTDEFCDRFGEPPKVTVRLLYIALCRACAAKAHISRVTQNGSELRFYCEKIELPIWADLFGDYPGMSFSGGIQPYIGYRVPKGKDIAMIAAEITSAYVREMHTASAPTEGEKK